MLPINRRVKKEVFPNIMAEGTFLSGPNFYLRYLNHLNDDPSLFGFVVPIKINKTSVGRHFIKRRMSAVVESLLTQIAPGFFCLIFCKRDVSTLSFQNLKKEITELLLKSKILK